MCVTLCRWSLKKTWFPKKGLFWSVTTASAQPGSAAETVTVFENPIVLTPRGKATEHEHRKSTAKHSRLKEGICCAHGQS